MIKPMRCAVPLLRCVNRLQPSRQYSPPSLEPAVDPVTIDKRENVMLIGLNRPHCRNAMNSIMAKQLKIVMKAFEDDNSSHVAILHGNGGDFCAGYDLKEVANGRFGESAKPEMIEYGPMGITRKPFKKPVIAAMEGYVVGGGLELALACDLRIAHKDVVIGGFNRKVGVPFIDGCTVRLPALIGLSRALDLILTGRAVKAEEALSFGLINRVTHDDLLGDAFKLAKEISDCPEFCLLTDRHNTYYSVYNANSLKDALDNEFANGWKAISVDSILGAKKFINRKK